MMRKMKIMKNGAMLALACAVTMGGANLYAQASGNVANKMFHYKANKTGYTDFEFKDDKTRTYAIVSVGRYADVTVLGRKTGGGSNHTCSNKVRCKLYTKYTIYNTVRPNYKYALLKLYSTESGSGFWSPDSTRNYTNVG